MRERSIEIGLPHRFVISIERNERASDVELPFPSGCGSAALLLPPTQQLTRFNCNCNKKAVRPADSKVSCSVTSPAGSAHARVAVAAAAAVYYDSSSFVRVEVWLSTRARGGGGGGGGGAGPFASFASSHFREHRRRHRGENRACERTEAK